MNRPATPKPRDYRARRQWQNDARARGETPECGRATCHNPAEPAWVNAGTPLLYCSTCARLINRYTPGLCTPETPIAASSECCVDGTMGLCCDHFCRCNRRSCRRDGR